MLTIAQAADYLNVSPEYATMLLDDGRLESEEVNGRKMIRPDDLARFKREMQKQAEAAMNRIIEITEEYNLYE